MDTAKTIKVEVVSSEKHIFSGEASFVVLQTINGELGVYPRHIPTMSLLKNDGIMRMQVPGKEDEVVLAISGGVVEILPDKITVLAETSNRSEDLDRERAMKSQELALSKIKDAKDDLSKQQAQLELEKALSELKALDYIKARKNK